MERRSFFQLAVAGLSGLIASTADANIFPTASPNPPRVLLQDGNTSIIEQVLNDKGEPEIHIHGNLKLPGYNFSARSKSFDISHPTEENKNLIYGCLEGPEHGVYLTARVQGARWVRVDLPSYWLAMVGGVYKVYLTSYKNHSVYVSDEDDEGFTVGIVGYPNDWSHPFENMDFSYEVRGSRLDSLLEPVSH